MKIPDDGFQLEAGVFALLRARKLASDLEQVCGSPIEIAFVCALCATIEGIGERFDIVRADEEASAATSYFIYPQKQIGRHRVDFLIGKAGFKPVIVECDGREFHHATRAQIERDRARDSELFAAGFKVLRYPGTQIHSDTWAVALDVLEEVDPTPQRRFWETYARFHG